MRSLGMNWYIAGSDTYTTTASGTTLTTTPKPVSAFAVQIVGTDAAATAWTVVLEGSLDNTNFSTILSHTEADGNGVVKWSAGSLYPSLYIRSRCSALTLGSATNIVAKILGVV